MDHRPPWGGFGHGSTPGMFHRMWRHPLSKYLGIFGVLLPAMVGVYYIYRILVVGLRLANRNGRVLGQTSNEEMGAFFPIIWG